MTAILVVLTIILFLSIDYLRTRAQRQAAVRTADAFAPLFDVDGFALPDGLFLAPGHTWARLERDGSIVMGIDELASQLIGPVDRVELAAAGTRLSRGDAALVVHRGDKELAFAAPLEGDVAEINTDALHRPDRLHDAPYEAGWLLRIKPSRLANGLTGLRIGDEARAWLRHEVKRIGDFVTRNVTDAAVGASMADGGVPVANVFEHLDAKAWQRFEQEFLLGA